MGSFKLSLELQDPNKREPTMLCVDDDVSVVARGRGRLLLWGDDEVIFERRRPTKGRS